MDSNPVKKKIYIIQLVLVFILITNVNAGSHIEIIYENPAATHSFLIEAVSWKSFPINCLAGDTLSGEFTLTSNGNLFLGDQTKYDNWLLDGIDFLIVDAENYELWLDDISTTSLFEKKGVVELLWSIKIPSDGTWYIIYNNDSIFMKQVEGSIQHISRSGSSFTFVVGLLGIASLLTAIFMFRKKK
jgi:hypothetical protein